MQYYFSLISTTLIFCKTPLCNAQMTSTSKRTLVQLCSHVTYLIRQWISSFSQFYCRSITLNNLYFSSKNQHVLWPNKTSKRHPLWHISGKKQPIWYHHWHNIALFKFFANILCVCETIQFAILKYLLSTKYFYQIKNKKYCGSIV